MDNRDVANKRMSVETIFLYGVFVCYVFFLLKILFISRVSLSDLFDSQRVIDRSINLIPFYSIKGYIFGNDGEGKRFAFSNIIGNIAIFIPLGTYLALFKKDKRIVLNLSFIFIVSLFVEIIQGLFGIGISDVDDIILNSLGGLVGVSGYILLLLLLRTEKRVHTALAIVSAIGLPRLLYLLFIVRLRL